MIVCFDVDGVLVEVSQSYYQALAQTVSLFLQAPVETQRLLDLKIKLNLNNDWDATVAGIFFYRSGLSFNDFVKLMHSGPQDFRKFYAEATRRNITLPDYQIIIEKFEALYRQLRGLETLNFSPSTLREIKSLAKKLAVITGRTKEDLDYTFQKHSLYQFFDLIITEDDLPGIEQRKPSPYPLQLLFQSCSYSWPACYIGDNLTDWQMVKNYEQAENKKVLFVLYKTPLNSGVAADYVVGNQTELLRLLKEINKP
ncbi:MAG: HAD family hydrolase [Candidatus Saccharicenans sp.]